MRRRAAFGALILMLAVVPGCHSSLLDLGSEADRQGVVDGKNEVMVNGIRVTLSLSPSEVERTYSFTARVSLTNTGSQTATWTSGYGCLAFLNVYRSGERIPLKGTDFGCIAAVGSWQIAPGDSLVGEYPLRAQRTDGAPLAPGEYRLEADLNTASGLTLEHRLVVK
ncbi:MAG: hypothetical protein M3220_10135 [Chloroflexota bacterium]|nr:hypothetical protein [Chloroflexota bacterium]